MSRRWMSGDANVKCGQRKSRPRAEGNDVLARRSVRIDVGRVTMAGELAICVCRKRSKTTSFRSLPQSSRRFSCHDYVTATKSRVEESIPGVSREDTEIETRASSRVKLLEMQRFCAPRRLCMYG